MNKIPSFFFERPDKKQIHFEIIKKAEQGSSADHIGRFIHHRHEFVLVMFVRKGTTMQMVDSESCQVAANQVLIVPQGCVHCEDYSHYQGYIFLFTYNFFSSEQYKTLQNFSILNPLSPRKVLDIGADFNINPFLEVMLREYAKEYQPHYALSLQSMLFSLLIMLESLSQHQSLQPVFLIKEKQIYKNFVQSLEKSYETNRSAAFYAQAINVSIKKLNQTLLNNTGKTASQIITDRVMLEAKRYLCYADNSIKEIAAQLNFEDEFYFSRVFKKKTGLSPSAFRQKYALKSM